MATHATISWCYMKTINRELPQTTKIPQNRDTQEARTSLVQVGPPASECHAVVENLPFTGIPAQWRYTPLWGNRTKDWNLCHLPAHCYDMICPIKGSPAKFVFRNLGLSVGLQQALPHLDSKRAFCLAIQGKLSPEDFLTMGQMLLFHLRSKTCSQ